jgi:uncharacterized protein
MMMMDNKEPGTAYNSQFLRVLRGNRTGVWTAIGGGVLIFVVWQLALVTVALASPLVRGMLIDGETMASAKDEGTAMALLLIGGFAPAFLVMLAWRKFTERKRVVSLFSVERFRWRLVWLSALVVGVFGLAITLPFDPESVAQIKERLARFSVQDWLLLTAIYSVGIFVQASFEEVFVRGWLLQQLSRCISNALVAILVTSLIFSALHLGHPGWATYVATLLMGLAFGWSAWRLGGLEAAMGAHFANNLVAALLTGQMVSGNAPTMDAAAFALYALYILGFLLFVEAWARFGGKLSRT